MNRRSVVIAGMCMAAAATAFWAAASQGQPGEQPVAAASQPASQPVQEKGAFWKEPFPPPLVTKFYPIGDLLIPVPDYTCDGFPQLASSGVQQGRGSGSIFSVSQPQDPEETPLDRPWQSSDKQEEIQHIARLLRDTVLPETWGAAGGRVRAFQGTLIVRQSEKGHEEVAAFLAALRQGAGRGVVIEAAWVRGDQSAHDGLLKRPADKADPRLVDAAALAKADVPYRARMVCRSGQQTFVTAGRGYTVVTAWNPTGCESGELAAVVSYARMGVLLKGSATLAPPARRAHVNLEGLIVLPRSEKAPAMPTRQYEISQVDFDVQDVVATVDVPLGQWVMAGGSSVPFKDKGRNEQMVLVIRVEAVGR